MTTPELPSVERGEMKMELPSFGSNEPHQESSMAEQARHYVAPPRWPQPGDKMRFLGENGYPFQLEAAMREFKVGEIVTVDFVEVASWHTGIKFLGRNGWHNSVMFERVSDEQPKAEDPKELSGDSHASAVAEPDALPLPSSPNKVEDLIRELRDDAKSHGRVWTYASRLNNAATLLQDKQSEISRLKKTLRRVHPNPADYRYWEGRYRDEAARAEAAEAQVASLKAALEPFADQARQMSKHDWIKESTQITWIVPQYDPNAKLKAGHFFRAAALSNTAADKGDGHE